jgi:hypothetical protein
LKLHRALPTKVSRRGNPYAGAAERSISGRASRARIGVPRFQFELLRRGEPLADQQSVGGKTKHAMAEAIADVIPHWMIATFQTILKLFNQAIQRSPPIPDGIVPVLYYLNVRSKMNSTQMANSPTYQSEGRSEQAGLASHRRTRSGCT